MNLCVVFDIDETMVQYYPKNATQHSGIEYLDSEDGSRLFFRPGLKEFLDFAKNTNKITLGICNHTLFTCTYSLIKNWKWPGKITRAHYVCEPKSDKVNAALLNIKLSSSF